MAKKKLLEDIKARPPRFYRLPADVVRDRRFTDDERLQIARAWADMAADDAIGRQIDDVILEIETRLTPLADETQH